MKVAILASGNGTNFEVLTKHFQNGDLPGEEVLLFCDHPDAMVINRARRLGVPYETFTVKSCGTKEAYEQKLLDLLKVKQVDFIILAGYLRIIGPTILTEYEGSIVNLHPAWLPEYPGLHSIERAFNDQRTQTGVTVHYIDARLDAGTIIAQRHVPIYPDDTLAVLENRVHATEHELYPETIKKILTERMAKER